MTHIPLITNRSSGGSDEDALGAIEAELSALGEPVVVSPASLDDFDDEVRDAARGAELIVVAGGDGTFNCAVNAVGDRLGELDFGLIPMGTGNDLARTLGLPMDALDAAGTVVDGAQRAIDVGRAAGGGVERLFVNACMGGFPVEVDEAIGGDLKRRLGPLAFWVGGARAAAELQRATVIVDGTEVEDCVAVGVGNGRTCGGGLCVWPRAVPDDGLLDGCVLAAESRAAALRLAARVRTCTHEQLPGVRTWRGSRIEIRARQPVEFNVDGELPGLATPVTFEVAGRMNVRVPRRTMETVEDGGHEHA